MSSNIEIPSWELHITSENTTIVQNGDRYTIQGNGALQLQFTDKSSDCKYTLLVVDYHPCTHQQYTLGPSNTTPTENCAGQIRIRSPTKLLLRPILKHIDYPSNHPRRLLPAGIGLLSSIGPILSWCYELLPSFHKQQCNHEKPDLSVQSN